MRQQRGKHAMTTYQVLQRLGAASTMKFVLHTGRTHQIRVHMADAGWPLLGDAAYGKDRKVPKGYEWVKAMTRHALHARLLEFEHPRDGKKLRFEAPLPTDLREVLTRLREMCSATGVLKVELGGGL